MCAISPTLHINLLQTKSLHLHRMSLNSKGDMTHTVIMGKNRIKPVLGILRSSNCQVMYSIEERKEIASSDLQKPGSY